MGAARTTVCGFAVVLLALTADTTASAQATATANQPSESPATRVVKRSVLADGTVQIEYADGTTKIVERSGTSSDQELEPVAPPEWLKDPATNQAFLRAMGQYYAYRESGLQHRRRVFEWQLFSSKVTFVTVLLLVGAGIAFAAIQFSAGLRRSRANTKATGTPPDDKEIVTQLELATTGIKVSSPVLGVIILLISLAFFYLYLVYVYPISELI
jgi:hypothetical protein